MRVVFDTNILVSFAIRPNANFEKMFDHVAMHGVILVSEETLDELYDVLSRDKFRRYIPLEQSIDFILWYAGISERIKLTEHIIACPDPKDDKFLSLAISGKAHCIVAGDRHLIDMTMIRGIPICRPAEFARVFTR